MTTLPEILYTKYIKAKEAVNSYTIKNIDKISGGMKSKASINKIHILNMWIDYLNNFIGLPISIEAKRPIDVVLSDITIIGSSNVILHIRDSNMVYTPICYLESSRISSDNITAKIVEAINSNESTYNFTGIAASLLPSNSIKLMFPRGATYNNRSIKASPNSISYTLSSQEVLSGGVDEVKQNLNFTPTQISNFTRLLDLIAAELGIKYKNSTGQIVSIESASLLTPNIPERSMLNIKGGESLSSEDGSPLEL